MPTPVSTPPPLSENRKFSPATKTMLPCSQQQPTLKADVDEGDSPRTLATDPVEMPKEEEKLPSPSLVDGDDDGKKQQDEDSEAIS